MRPGHRGGGLRPREVAGLLLILGLLAALTVSMHSSLPGTRCPAEQGDHPALATKPCPSLPPLPPPTVAGTPPPTSPPPPPYLLRIVVFTYNRLDGLQRLLRSLVQARYPGVDPRTHQLALHVYMDFPKKPDTVLDGTRAFLDAFVWPHGPMALHRREVNVGLKRNIMEAWYPVGNGRPLHELREYSVFFEDDIEVSPHWFVWADEAIRTYSPAFVGLNDANRKLLGLSLFRPVKDELSQRMAVVESAGNPFLLQQPCSWGAVYFPHLWQPFRQWYQGLPKGFDPAVHDAADEGVRPDSNTWASSSSWKKFLIRLMYDRGWYMVYPNLPDRTVLSTNHLMKGEHPTPPKALFELPLFPPAAMRDPQIIEDTLHRLPPLAAMRAFDVMFRDKGTGPRGLPNYAA